MEVSGRSCPFCLIAAGNADRRLAYEDEEIVAFEDINPQAPHHLLIVPRKHMQSLLEIEEEDAALVGRLVLVANRIARDRGIDLSGFRLVVNCNPDGGQTVYHLHLHLLGGRRMGWPPG
jgi:histidine triad (HIT) family protein